MSKDAEHEGGKPDRAQAWSALDKTLAEARSKFADMAPDELESLINEAVAAARVAPAAKFIDETKVQAEWEDLLAEIERGSRFIITRDGKAMAVMIRRPIDDASMNQPDQKDLASAIRQRFAPFGGIDDLEPHPTVPVRAAPSFDAGMKHTDFRIGGTFQFGGQRYRCTDIGKRVVTAIKLDHEDDPSWYNGPPYAVAEVVFDEYDIEGCSPEAPSDAELPSSKMELDAGNDTGEDDWFGAVRQAQRIAQTQSLRDQARAGGLRFNAYLPPGPAEWLLGHIERGTFTDPSEATFVMLGEQQELEPHADLRREFLKRRIQAGIDSGPARPAEEVFERLRKSLAEPRPEPAFWKKLS